MPDTVNSPVLDHRSFIWRFVDFAGVTHACTRLSSLDGSVQTRASSCLGNDLIGVF